MQQPSVSSAKQTVEVCTGLALTQYDFAEDSKKIFDLQGIYQNA